MLICYPCGKKDTSFDIPDSVTTVGDSAFDNCKQLTSVKYQGTIEMWGELDISEEWVLRLRLHRLPAPMELFY